MVSAREKSGAVLPSFGEVNCSRLCGSVNFWYDIFIWLEGSIIRQICHVVMPRQQR